MAEVRSTAMAQILSQLASRPGSSSAEIQKATGLGSGALFPALAALEYDNLVVSAWEDVPPPRRRLYSLTPAGREKVGAMPPAPAPASKPGVGNWFWQRFVAPLFGG